MREIIAYLSDDGTRHFDKESALRADTLLKARKKFKANQKALKLGIKEGDEFEKCFSDTGGVVWSYKCKVIRDIEGNLVFQPIDKQLRKDHSQFVYKLPDYARIEGNKIYL